MVEMADRLDGMEHIVTAELVDDNKILLLNFYEVSKLKKKGKRKQHLGHSCRVMIISRRTCHSQRLNGSQLHLIICRVSGCGSTNGIKKHGKANTFQRCLSGQQRTRASWRAFSRLTAKTLTRTYGMLLTDSGQGQRQNDWQRSTEKSSHRLICGWSR